uniref:Uncharacterized protein n=1 Tax=Anguilla anguilla TaxID=7936 RepID=A0A0E9PXF5_ANGAN
MTVCLSGKNTTTCFSFLYWIGF